MSEVLSVLAERGDLAHVALGAWAGTSTSLLLWALKQLIQFNKRFEEFMCELEKLNHILRMDLSD
ncbi:hypothetical protein PsAD2_00966 [Pseudovibrio axinellae]|uniref:Uncharacterized protein n=1 Tax=Pseudovibrio axinellae TaxID=989403 RepID=A0A161V7U4_9HYPH|nr:hypothetical protein [Pseudovibrio axinellae]KZL20974.1 hypothetical protein PsAD2_00966 [Pseudovibrio axinellae]SEP80660.1 hypothetical protein SAMN05421798_101435 [Pseudovibrio axinellae]